MTKSKRINEIDVASGLAIFLVVLGYLSDSLPDWYGVFKGTLYKFHMPFFMFISGFLLSYTRYNYKDLKSYISFIHDKFIRFGIPYLFMSFLFLGVKYILKEYDSATMITVGLQNIFIEPTSGPSIFLWYIYVLFLFYLVFPLFTLIPFIKRRSYLILIIGIVLYSFNSVPGLFELDLFCKYFLFFAIGFETVKYYSLVNRYLVKYGVLILFLFIGLVIAELNNLLDTPMIFLGLFSIPSILYLAILFKNSKSIQYIGYRTFVIYIWNSVFIFGLSYILRRLDSNFYSNFYLYFPLLVLIGISGPLLLKYASRKFRLQLLHKIIP